MAMTTSSSAPAFCAPLPVPKSRTFQPDIYPKVLSLLPEDRSTRILDVGAGQGYLCRKVKDLGYDVHACDFREDDFRCPDVPFVKADVSRHIPVPDDSFDCVVSIEVMEHVENHFQLVREMVRVTRPGGRIIITTPNVLSFPSRWYYFLYGYTDCAPFPINPDQETFFMEHINPISVPEILFCLESAGADMVQLTTNRLRRAAWIPMILLYPWLAAAIRLRFLRGKFANQRALHRRHIRWVTHPANLMGRITIAVGEKRLAGAEELARAA